MLSAKRQPTETLEAWENRLILAQGAAIMALPEHEYRRRKAEACAPIRLRVPNLPDAQTLNDKEYAAAKAKAGIFTASLMR